MPEIEPTPAESLFEIRTNATTPNSAMPLEGFDAALAHVIAAAQLEVLAWIDEQGVDCEQLDMALERFVEPYGLTHIWRDDSDQAVRR